MISFLLGFATGLFIMSGGVTTVRDWVRTYLDRP